MSQPDRKPPPPLGVTEAELPRAASERNGPSKDGRRPEVAAAALPDRSGPILNRDGHRVHLNAVDRTGASRC